MKPVITERNAVVYTKTGERINVFISPDETFTPGNLTSATIWSFGLRGWFCGGKRVIILGDQIARIVLQ